MSMYIIVLDSPDESKTVWPKVRKSWPKPQHFIVDDRVAFIATKEKTLLVGDILKQIGMTKTASKPVTGFVSRLGPNNGLWQRDLWEWMERFE